jgi:hypothetical protein
MLVFEFMDQDLKKYMDSLGGPVPPALIRSFLVRERESVCVYV